MISLIFSYYIWVIPLALLYVFIAYGSIKVNQQVPHWSWITYIATNLIPAWIIIARYSKNLLLDGIIFDISMLLPYVIATAYFTQTFHEIKPINYIGFAMIVAGMILFRVK